MGKTVDANSRFRRYIDPKSTSLRLQRRMKRACGEVLVRILDYEPDNLIEAELGMIAARAPEISNKVGSLRHYTTTVGAKRANKLIDSQLARCPICDNENFKDGKHLCLTDRVEALNPMATGHAQALLRGIGMIDFNYEVPRERPLLKPARD